ncbi:MAG TPA: hypothetical protein VK553_10910 [Candidatus Nitrosopolaris rasttigaisensis]|nr:hypothetical protein [Candidatus Nitrosopolaris rasttigaisensis]
MHVKRYEADLIVMTDADVIKNGLEARDNQSGLTSIFNGNRTKVYRLKNMQFTQKEALSLRFNFCSFGNHRLTVEIKYASTYGMLFRR